MADGVQAPNPQQQAPSFQAAQPAPSTPQKPTDNPPQEPAISWTASEFIAHSKTAGWYGVLAGGAIGVAAIFYFLTKDRITTAMIIIGALLFGIMASRKPRELSYALDLDGIRVDKKMYRYENFKSFSVIQEGGVESIWFMPLQRFMPGLSIYFAPEDGDRIVSMLGNFLPFEPRDTDPLDKLMHRLRF